MADKIPADAPRAPQSRKQVMDEHGSFRPVAETEQSPGTPAPEVPTIHPFQIGDAVTLTGRVLEIQHPQGGQVSVKVQTPQGAGWFRGEHIEPVAEPKDDCKDARIAELQNELDSVKSKAEHDRHARDARIAELEAALKSAVPVKK